MFRSLEETEFLENFQGIKLTCILYEEKIKIDFFSISKIRKNYVFYKLQKIIVLYFVAIAMYVAGTKIYELKNCGKIYLLQG